MAFKVRNQLYKQGNWQFEWGAISGNLGRFPYPERVAHLLHRLSACLGLDWRASKLSWQDALPVCSIQAGSR